MAATVLHSSSTLHPDSTPNTIWVQRNKADRIKLTKDAPFQSPPSSVSQKVPVDEPPSGSTTGALKERVARFHSLLFHFLEFLNKSSSDKILPFSRRP